MKSEQKIYIRGVKNRGREVIKTLEDLGGKNFMNLNGENEDHYYYIEPRGKINCTCRDDSLEFAFVKEFYKEIKLPKWKPKNNETYYRITWIGEVAEDIWYGSRNDKSGYKFGNCFKTKKEAIKARDLVRLVLANRLNK